VKLVDEVFQDWGANRENQFSRSALVTYRLGHLIAKSSLPVTVKGALRLIHRVLNAFVLKVINAGYIQPLAEIGPRLRLPNGLNGVFINRYCKIGSDVVIYQQVTLGANFEPEGREAPTVGNGVVIGAGAKVIGGVTVGDRAVIGANSLVSKDVPPDTVAIGIPARIVRLGRGAEIATSGAGGAEAQVQPQ
jgi:serine O-acetyltransferase